MNRIKISATLGLLAILAFGSCKKDYTCTCTTSVGSVSNTVTHDLPNQTHSDAKSACDHFQSDANNNGVGTTNCHL